MSDVAEKVQKIIVDQLGVSADEVKPDASFVEDLGADSLDLTELIMAMEEEFDIEIADEDAQKILKVQDAINYIDSKKSSAPAGAFGGLPRVPAARRRGAGPFGLSAMVRGVSPRGRGIWNRWRAVNLRFWKEPTCIRGRAVGY